MVPYLAVGCNASSLSKQKIIMKINNCKLMMKNIKEIKEVNQLKSLHVFNKAL